MVLPRGNACTDGERNGTGDMEKEMEIEREKVRHSQARAADWGSGMMEKGR